MTEPGDHVVDTHALVWHLTDAPELSSAARTILVDADAGNQAIIVPTIVLVEIIYLVEKDRFPRAVLARVVRYLSEPDRPYREAQLDLITAQTVERVPRTAVPDMPDRIIAATALALGLPLISADERIRNAGVVPVIW